jgi:hypothetical protein
MSHNFALLNVLNDNLTVSNEIKKNPILAIVMSENTTEHNGFIRQVREQQRQHVVSVIQIKDIKKYKYNYVSTILVIDQNVHDYVTLLQLVQRCYSVDDACTIIAYVIHPHWKLSIAEARLFTCVLYQDHERFLNIDDFIKILK